MQVVMIFHPCLFQIYHKLYSHVEDIELLIEHVYR